ncbi:MAG: DNA internalization-related competence protein ComEC/Rec2 [Deltaproteobacteria bacterium]|uniref:DNA internalization-related competence protein ComEC/Rec2 n=1 Tax=Candidatus Zymogenus saltonus TaxID=2844893 RepID=A0A9D8KD83_9DELT|nr:DNA internalization-related competence protein ComEC/Rec2 [Candidatus Zymogenus saltonus]
MKHPLLLLASALALGIGLGTYIRTDIPPLLIIAGILLTLTAMIRERIRLTSHTKGPALPSAHHLYFVLIGLLFVILGLLLICPVVNPKTDSDHISNFASNEYRTIAGTVSLPPDFDSDSTRIVLKDVMIKDGRKWIDVKGRLGVTIYERTDSIGYGDVIFYRGKIRNPTNFNNPGGFDYVFYLKRRSISSISYIKGRDYFFVSENVSPPTLRKIEEIRRKIRTFIDTAVPITEGAILKALIIGERSEIPEDLYDSYRRTGMAHILAISGMHIGIIFLISFSVLHVVLVRIPRLALIFPVKTFALIVSLLPIFLYTILSGLKITAVRSTIMITAYVLSVVIGRDRDLLNTLSLAALIILIVSPASLFDPAFQLSFTAVMSIILIYPLLTDPVKNRIYSGDGSAPTLGRRLLLRGYQFAAVSVSALFGILPISAHYFYTESPLSILMNFAVVPLLGFFAVPLSLVSIPLVFISGEVAGLLLDGAAGAVTISNWMINGVDSLFPGGFAVIPPRLPEMVLYYLILVVVIFYANEYRRRSLQPRQSVKSRLRIIFVVLLSTLVLLLSYQALNRYHPKRLSVTFINVGQGDSTLIKFPGGRTMLIDGGGFHGGGFDTGRSIVSPYLLHERIRRIDYLVLTHPEFDHYGGIEYILKNFNVGEFWVTEAGMDSEEIEDLRSTSKMRNVPIVTISDDTTDLAINGAVVEFLHPPPGLQTKGDMKSDLGENLNNSSIVFRIKYGYFSLLMTGDIEAEAERLIMSKNRELKSLVLKSPHHGSNTSSGITFLNEVEPAVVVIMCGEKERFGFPKDETLERYEYIGAVVFRTDIDGAVIVKSDGDGFEIESVNGKSCLWRAP